MDAKTYIKAVADDRETHRTLVRLVKADECEGVKALMEGRRNAAQLINSKPDNCLPMAEATSARMVEVLTKLGGDPKKEDAHGYPATAWHEWATGGIETAVTTHKKMPESIFGKF
ncbi:MAG: hypothetical protein EON60_11915 [Alphaproteobacteria bacterium]|nr:MAG: hypothetical protein EON60_11915 [Alphaproteobacteria bacterium]